MLVNTKDSAGQCPCVKSGPASGCMAYSPQYQASTVEEMIMNFKDLSKFHPKTNVPMDPNQPIGYSPIPKEHLICHDDRCRKCGSYVMDHLHPIFIDLPDSRIRNASIRELQILRKRIAPQRQSFPKVFCERLKLGPVPFTAKKVDVSDEEIDDLIFKIKGESNASCDCVDNRRSETNFNNPMPRKKETFSSHCEKPTQNRRKRRQAAGIASAGDLKCVKKGDPVDGGDFAELCTTCWQVLTLEDGYFPPFINQLACSDDTDCLTGLGTCQEKKKAIQVLKKSGSDYNPVTITISVACLCQVQAGSKLMGLVQG